jgi:hypothetical protein
MVGKGDECDAVAESLSVHAALVRHRCKVTPGALRKIDALKCKQCVKALKVLTACRTYSAAAQHQQSSTPATHTSRLAHPVSLPMLIPAMPPCIIIPSCCASAVADSRASRITRVSCCIVKICSTSEAEPSGVQCSQT